MKYAISFYQGCKAIDKVDEIIIKYTQRTTEIFNFVKTHKHQRVIANVTMLENLEDSIDIFTEISKKYDNFSLMISYGGQEEIIPKLKENNIKFFFYQGAKDLDTFKYQCDCGVSDIYIFESLAFDLVNISKYCKQNNIKVRVFANVAQSPINNSNDTFKNFFIRPEDVQIYEDFIDVIEFFGPLNRQNILYEIYISGKWLGSLDDLILGLNENIDNTTIAPGFAEKRVGCQKKCAYDMCKMCDRILELSNTMKEKGYSFNEKEIDNENTIIKNYLFNGSEKTSIYDAEVSEAEVQENYF